MGRDHHEGWVGTPLNKYNAKTMDIGVTFEIIEVDELNSVSY